MYYRLGQLVVRHAVPIVLGWALLMGLLAWLAPRWHQVTKDGEFAFLPESAQTVRAADLYKQAFLAEGQPRGGVNPLYSNIVVVAYRHDRRVGQEGMDDADYEFIETVVVPELRRVAATTGRGYEALTEEQRTRPRPELPYEDRLVTDILTRVTEIKRRIPDPGEVIGRLLTSEDDRSSLIYLQLRSEFLDRSNNLLISEVERVIKDPVLVSQKPFGLAFDLSGTAVVGRDVLRAEQESASRTEHLTQWLVIVLLLLIYRAPLMALIPLITVGLSVQMTVKVLSLLAGWGWIGVFTGLEVYVTVVVYGAGVDYCLFLIARYREELDRGLSFGEAMQDAVGRVGAALATSAGTSIFGIGMMAFADFGKFSQAGIAISLGLTVVLLLALSFTPAILHLCGRWAFWPDLRHERIEAGTGWLPTLSLTRFLSEQAWLERGWQKVADLLLARPATVFLATSTLLMPLAVVGFLFQGHLRYGFLTDLPQQDPSVLGAKAVQTHFPAGITGPTVVLLQHPEFNLQLHSQVKVSREIVETLRPQLADLRIADIRCQAYPLGLTETAQSVDREFITAATRRALINRAKAMYTSTAGPFTGQVMQMELVFAEDPFQRESYEQLNRAEAALRAAVPPAYRDGVQLFTLGPTASLRDLKQVTDRDRVVIDILVVIVVYLVLIALLRRPAVCAYLLVTVVFSYLVTIGATYIVFWLREPGPTAELDWKIPLFLFTILIAIGEDYNILLMARVTEEQERHGLIKGVLVALTKTGSIISSCGIIMAGTFASLMSGTLLGMVQMGFALAFGVLLDTFVVRPILVPAYLILLYSGRFGALGRWLGAPPVPELQGSAVESPPVLPAPGEPGDFDSRSTNRARTGERVDRSPAAAET